MSVRRRVGAMRAPLPADPAAKGSRRYATLAATLQHAALAVPAEEGVIAILPVFRPKEATRVVDPDDHHLSVKPRLCRRKPCHRRMRAGVQRRKPARVSALSIRWGSPPTPYSQPFRSGNPPAPSMTASRSATDMETMRRRGSAGRSPHSAERACTDRSSPGSSLPETTRRCTRPGLPGGLKR